jgi:adenylyl-sulfate kinase
MTSSSPPVLPALQISDAAVADLQLVLDGVRLPWGRLGGDLGDLTESGSRRAGPGAGTASTASPASAVAVAVPADLVDAVRSAGAVLLVDQEQTPLARLTELEVVPSAPGPGPEGTVMLGGRVRPERDREARLFADLVRTPAQLEPDAGRRTLLVTRPPLAGELAGPDARPPPTGPPPTGPPPTGPPPTGPPGPGPVLLVPAETATPDGVPAHVLVQAVQAAAAEQVPDALVVPVPLHWRDPASDQALAAAVLSAYGEGSTDAQVLSRGPAWADLLAALHRGDDVLDAAGLPGAGQPGAPAGLPGAGQPAADPLDAASPSVRAVLRRWRPPRSRRGLVVLFTGLSGSGKSTVARDLAEHVRSGTERTVSLLDGDDVRRLLSSGLGFDRASRDLNVRRIGYLAAEVARHGGLAVCAPIAPYAGSREAVRQMVRPVGDFVLVHVSTPLAECERRDLKGLYAKARSGEIGEFTGISDPYDVPLDADLSVDTSAVTRAQALTHVISHLSDGGWLEPRRIP